MTAIEAAPPPAGSTGRLRLAHVALAAILLAAVFTRFWRLDTPAVCYFDEVYFPTTGAEILHGDDKAWEFYGHENTHPPLSKLLMAAGMGIFGHADPGTAGNGCWGDAEDAAKKLDPSWTYEPFGWRFFGALAGVGAVIFMYLLARRLFQSEVAGLAGAFLLTFEGLAFAQSRIATPDTYVLFFVLACVYFLVSERFLLAGLFLGAAAASKWVGAYTMAPIVAYFIWMFLRRFRETEPDESLRNYEAVLIAGLAVTVVGGAIGGAAYVLADTFIGFFFAVPGIFVVLGALAVMLFDGTARDSARGRLYLETGFSFPIFFILVPGIVYTLTYIPMFLNGHSPVDAWELNEGAYNFHRTLDQPHGYSSPWYTWPVLARPLYLYAGAGNARIYSLGNPLVFWIGLVALGFVVMQALRYVKVRLDADTGALSVKGFVTFGQAPLLFVVLGFLGFWLPWAAQGRVLFLYHYLPALAFVILAFSYFIHRLWYDEQRLGRFVAVGLLAAVAVTFIYFYPHLAAVDVPGWLERTYYWEKLNWLIPDWLVPDKVEFNWR